MDTVVLVVEDSLIQRELLRRTLEKEGFIVMVAKDGVDALNNIKAKRPDVVVSDIAMPEMDGYEMCRNIKENPNLRNLPVILLTELSGPECIVNGLDCGADNFMFKPYDKLQLINMIQYQLFSATRDVNETSTAAIDLHLAGKVYNINFERRQILNLLISTFESAAKQNRELIATQLKLQEKTAQLEDLNKLLEKQVQEEIEKRMEKEKLLIQKSKMASMGEMVSAIAHQWRQPLNSLGLIIQDIEDAYEFEELNREYIKQVIRDSMMHINYMSRTIDDFRNFFKHGNEKVHFDVKMAVKEIINMVSSELKKSNVSYKYICDCKKGEPVEITQGDSIFVCNCEAFSVYGSPNELMQAVLNIIINAKDAILQKKATNPDIGVITVDLSRKDGKIYIKILDDGGGIKEELISKIFEPYFTTKQDEGTGIGLYMTKQIIEESMDGILYVRNVGQGAQFTIELTEERKA